MKFTFYLLVNMIVVLPIQLIIQNVINIKYPFFYIGSNLYSIINFLILIFISISTTKMLKESSYNIKELPKRYIIIFIINIIIIFLYCLFSFRLISPFLSFVFSLSSFIASLYLHEETTFYNKSNTWLVPYIIWTFYLTLLNMSIFVINQ